MVTKRVGGSQLEPGTRKPGWQVDLEARANHGRALKSTVHEAERVAEERDNELKAEHAKFKTALEVIASGEADAPFHVAAEALGQRPSYADLLAQVEDLQQLNSVYLTILEAVKGGTPIEDFDYMPEAGENANG